MHSRYTWIRWGKLKKKNFILNRLGRRLFSSQRRRIRYFAFFTETKWHISRDCAVDYTAVIFFAHLVAVKCKVFTTTVFREIQLCTWPVTQLTCSPLLPADFTCQSIAHVQKSKWKGSIVSKMVIIIDYLATWRKKQKSLWNCYSLGGGGAVWPLDFLRGAHCDPHL